MGLFNLRKNKKACAGCACPLDGGAWTLDDRTYCRACYNRQAEKQLQDGTNFQLQVEDVFLIRGQCVIVTGRVSQGVIHLRDTVTINGAPYTVTCIDVPPTQEKSAGVGKNVGLRLSTLDAGLFKRGDLVTVTPVTEPIA
ncbi:MAG: hypothetical protein J1E00_03140 [Oscillospiraceae bacterium]|nr:hypothetical protein [Oscillospiraceae bacterium]